MLERHARVGDTEGLPRVVLEPSSAFFDAVEADADKLPTWTGELYFEKHRGTYTSQADVKAGNRWGESALAEAELWSAFTPTVGDARPELDAAWKLLLTQQFHDILPGSSIHWVYEDARRDHAEVQRIAGAVRDRSLDAIAADVPAPSGSVVVFNALSHGRSGVVVLDAASLPSGSCSVVDVHGVVHPVQPLHDGRWAVPAELPSCGWATVEVRPDGAPGRGSTVSTVDVSERHLENDRLRVAWDDAGHLRSIFDKVEGREVVPPGRPANVFQLQFDRPREYDAWDLDREWLDRVEDIAGPESIEVVDSGPLLAAVRLHWRFGSSSITQVVSLVVDSPVLTFDTTVDWHEEHRLLKVAFPVDVRSPRATYEVQYGNVERSTHENTSYDVAQFEVCAHRWADLSEHDYGVALLNDCKYGYDIKGDVMRLSLLRSSTMPDPEADRGHHRFRYALLPHAGSYRDAGVVQRAAELGVTPQVRSVGDGQGQPGCRCLVASSHPGAVISAVKPADVGEDLVVRLYEAWGGRRRTTLTVDLPIRSVRRADLLEQPLDAELAVADDGTIEVDLSPFEIVTLLLAPE
jgi:alpha-mannosidase